MVANNSIWGEMVKIASAEAERRGGPYSDKLKFEIAEINKQEASMYWVRLYNDGHKYDTNKNGLVLPFLLGMTPVDPVVSGANHQIVHQTDWPDIDLDCLPEARDKIKEYVIKKYGEEFVCSVGAWSTYKFKLALQDTTRALNGDLTETMKLTKTLTDDVDMLKDGGYALCASCSTKHNKAECPNCASSEIDGVTIGKILAESEELQRFAERYPEIVNMAVRMVGRIKTLSKHAGGVIISSEKLFGRIPMAKTGSGDKKLWTSMWVEGLSGMQLSSFGFTKWDVLGLKTLLYIHKCCNMIEQTRGYKFNIIPWKGMDPTIRCAGYYFDEKGVEHTISMDDHDAIEIANSIKMETVFQFETDVQRGVLSKGVKSFEDLRIYNAMGHPGPIACIGPESNINVENGVKKVIDLTCGDKILYLDKDGAVASTGRFLVVNNGRKKLYRVKLKSGRTLQLTSDHKIRTEDGYVEVCNLKQGCRITGIY